MHSFEHAFFDSIKILPFLFLTYIIMEVLEEKTGEKTNQWLQKAGKFGPVIGGVVGIIPQCGMSAVASNLYAGRIISVGTLMAIFLSTSDEMLPIMLANGISFPFIGKVLAIKILIAIVAGILVDYVVKLMHFNQKIENKIHDFCEDGVIKSSLRHTIHVFVFVFLVTFIFNVGIEAIGEEALRNLIMNKPILGPILSAMVGLIPNCAASVVITQMFLDGMITLGTLLAGLLVGAGVGILVLLRVNENKRESIIIIGILYIIGVLSGILFNLM